MGASNTVEIMNWLSKEEINKLKNDREPVDAPNITKYKYKPNNSGKLLWFSGMHVDFIDLV